jgi:hypothetical protein
MSVSRLRKEYPDKKDVRDLRKDHDLFLCDAYIEPIMREALSKGGKSFAYDEYDSFPCS